jgi:hypothetical protein
MEFIKLLVVLAAAWLGWRYIVKKSASEGKADKPPTAPPIAPASPPETPVRRREPPEPPTYLESVDEDKSTGRRALRQMCREALQNKAIDLAEALQLLEAFEAYCVRFNNPSHHIEYIRHELFQAVEDGQIDADESQELVTLLGEFADVGLYGHTEQPTAAPAAAPRMAPRAAPAPRPRAPRAKLSPATSSPPRVMPDGRYLMTYTNAEGEASEREIKPKRIERRGDHLYLVSYCLKTRGPRTFRVDRIESLVDADTGEILVL